MNYLMHLCLSEDNAESMVGTIMGDFVKGRLDDRSHTEVRRCMDQYRRIDSFAAGNNLSIRSNRNRRI